MNGGFNDIVLSTSHACLCSYLEAEGLERTFKFKQEDIAAAVPLASSLQVCCLVLCYIFDLWHVQHDYCVYM